MRLHFVNRHVHDTVVMLEEGNLPLPWCHRCDLQVPRKALNGRHLGNLQCKKGWIGSGDGWKRRRRGKTQSGRSTPMGNLWRRCRSSATSGGY